ncbi:MAG TPA: hypothetical protein VKA77_04315 [Mycobacterium sp.]|nr:hypothetical protein [Mycobacterium sp.]
MPERVADAIEEIARPNRDDQQEKPQIESDPALRRPRFIRNTPVAVVAAMVLVGAIPRCTTPRPWQPYLAAKEQDDGQDS